MQRIMLFLATNFAIMVVLNISISVLGLEEWFAQGDYGINVPGLLLIALVFGMGGAFISLAMSKSMAKRSMGVRMIEQAGNAQERWLLETLASQAKQAGIAQPEFGIFPSQQPNAFATGMRRNQSLVAVSEGLLSCMNRREVEAVLAHEVTHIANGDMVTLTLIQGVINTFVIFFSRVIGHVVDRVIFKSRGYGPGYFITVIIAQVLLSILASIIVMWFSRQREFRADAGGAQLAGRASMVAALEKLQMIHKPSDLPSGMASFGISGKADSGLRRLFLSHPPLSERIARLQSDSPAA